jgi:phosphate transport system substrate-binding protein
MVRSRCKTITLIVILAASQTLAARDFVLAVGSSTVYPFAATAAERIGKVTRFKTPQVEARGSGGGFKLFCKGGGVDAPDIALASREIKVTEEQQCIANGVGEVEEISFGYDGIVFALSRDAPELSLTLRDIYLALAKHVPDPSAEKSLVVNPYTHWSQLNPALPDIPIKVYGPPITSGARDVLAEHALEPGCRSFDWLAAQPPPSGDGQQVCSAIREDGYYVSIGENDNLIVRKLVDGGQSVGIFGFSFFDQNRDKLQAADIESVQPNFETLYEQRYPLVRPLYVYIRKAHIGWIPGLGAFLREIISEQAAGEDGYLVDRGLVPLAEEQRQANAEKVKVLTSGR